MDTFMAAESKLLRPLERPEDHSFAVALPGLSHFQGHPAQAVIVNTNSASQSVQNSTGAPSPDISAVSLILYGVDGLGALEPRAAAILLWELPRAPVLQPLQEVPPWYILTPIARPNYSLHQQIEPLISHLRSSSLRSARHIRLYARAWSGYLGSVQSASTNRCLR